MCLIFANEIIFTTGFDIGIFNDKINEASKAAEMWCNNNHITVNPIKTVCQLFILLTKHYNINVKFETKDLDLVDHFFYQGVNFHNSSS